MYLFFNQMDPSLAPIAKPSFGAPPQKMTVMHWLFLARVFSQINAIFKFEILPFLVLSLNIAL